jgi:hypothetical protein
VFSQLSISRFGSCFTQKTDFGTPKMEKAGTHEIINDPETRKHAKNKENKK